MRLLTLQQICVNGEWQNIGQLKESLAERKKK